MNWVGLFTTVGCMTAFWLAMCAIAVVTTRRGK